MVAYGIFINSKFSHLCMKHNVHHMSTCTEYACIYALFKITDNFVARCLQSHAQFQPRVEESCMVCWHIPWISQTPTRNHKGKIAKSWWPFLITI